MRAVLYVRLWVAIIVLGLGCVVPGSEETDEPPPPAPVISLDGTVTYVDLEGGFYGINADDGQAYLPLDLDTHFQKDGLRVRFKARKDSVATAQQWGIPIRIILMSTL